MSDLHIPATRENPRLVSREMIDLYERDNPALEGIGAIMVDMGIWRLPDGPQESGRQTARGCA